MYMYVVLLLQLSCEMYSFDNDFTLHIYTVHVCTYMLPTYVYMYMSTCICISMYHHTMYYVCTCGCGVQGGSTVYVHVHVGVVCRVAVLCMYMYMWVWCAGWQYWMWTRQSQCLHRENTHLPSRRTETQESLSFRSVAIHTSLHAYMCTRLPVHCSTYVGIYMYMYM